MHNIKNLIVGCGFSGATMARKIAEDFGEEVLVIDAKTISAAILTTIMTRTTSVSINTARIFSTPILSMCGNI